MRLHKQTGDKNVVDESGKLVLRHAQDPNVLYKYVNRDLQKPIKKPMVHSVQRQDTTTETVDLVMLVVVMTGAWECSMHSNMDPGKHKVVGHNSKANFCHEPRQAYVAIISRSRVLH